MVGLGVSREIALRAATATPADVIGRADLGRIRIGAPADLVWWDESLSVREVWLAGTRLPRQPHEQFTIGTLEIDKS